MRRLWTMLAHFHGNIWNALRLSASLGVSYHTVNRYTDILEQTFLVRKLQPYYANVGKRLVKSPKIYLRDSGLLHYFLGIHDVKTLDVHPSRGASWEGFLLEQVISGFSLTTPGAQAFYWRTARGEEVDLLILRGSRITPIEIKRHSAPRKEDASGLISCMRDLGVRKGYILYPGDTRYSLGGGIEVVPAQAVLSDYSTLIKL